MIRFEGIALVPRQAATNFDAITIQQDRKSDYVQPDLTYLHTSVPDKAGDWINDGGVV
jgi:hypothetical protein